MWRWRFVFDFTYMTTGKVASAFNMMIGRTMDASPLTKASSYSNTMGPKSHTTI